MLILKISVSTAPASPECGCKKWDVNSKNNQLIGTSPCGKTSKIHIIADALGNPVHFLLTGGQVHDAKAAVELLSGVEIAGSNILGGKAYGAAEIRDYITRQNTTYTIPPKENTVEPWFCDFVLYKERYLVECFINKLKVFRRIATRYDKLAVSFLAFIYLGAICIFVKMIQTQTVFR